jgi:hypothetical protein
MTNPASAMRLLITYVICIPLAILVGYLLTNPLDYGTLGFLGLVVALLISPVFIKWHYPLLLFGLCAPITCFFLIGRPPIWQVVSVLSLGIAVLEGILNSNRQFVRVPALTWPFLFLMAVVFLTAELNGGIGLHTLGGDVGNGRKYLNVFFGVASYFALTSRAIPPNRRKLYLALFTLSGLLSLLGDLFPYLPAPFNYINLLIPPSNYNAAPELGSTGGIHIARLSAFSATAGALMTFMLVKWGTRGIFRGGTLWRPAVFVVLFMLIPLGGFRGFIFAWVLIIGVMLCLEGQRGPLLAVLFGGLLTLAMVAPFASQLPLNYQRTFSFLPLKWDTGVVMDAEGSSEWRYNIWRSLEPKIPQYLLLGKGYGMSKEDYDLIANRIMANSSARFDASEESLAISSDYHSGPFSTLICFGLWGAIGIVWLMAACLWVHYRNFRYGPPELKAANAFLLAECIYHSISFIFIFGAFDNDIGYYARYVGLSVALNGGVLGPKSKAVSNPLIKPLPAGAVQTA